MAAAGKPLRVAIDGHTLVHARKNSIATYLTTLLTHWARLKQPPEIHLLLPALPAREPEPDSVLRLPNVRLVTPARDAKPDASYRRFFWWQEAVLPGLIRRVRPIVYFSPYHLTPQLPWGVPMVTTIHDLCYLYDDPPTRSTWIQRGHILSAAVRAARLICVSEFTREALARCWPRAASKASVVHNGVDAASLDEPTARRLVNSLDPELAGAPYLMWIGVWDARKCPELLLEIYRAHQQRFPGHRYVIVIPARQVERVGLALEGAGLTRVVKVVSDVDGLTRDALYRQALALVFPSKCEGFGYPVLEAMLQGCPPVALANGPAREIVGKTAPLAGAATVEAFAGVLAQGASLTGAERQHWAAKLQERARCFHGQKMAAATLDVLLHAAG